MDSRILIEFLALTSYNQLKNIAFINHLWIFHNPTNKPESYMIKPNLVIIRLISSIVYQQNKFIHLLCSPLKGKMLQVGHNLHERFLFALLSYYRNFCLMIRGLSDFQRQKMIAVACGLSTCVYNLRNMEFDILDSKFRSPAI